MSSDEKKETNDSKEKRSKRKKLKKKLFRFILFCILIIALIVIVRFTLKKWIWNGNHDNLVEKIDAGVSEVINGEEGHVTTISEASLKKVFEITELSTADYTFNAIAKAYEEDETTIRYYVAYESTVKVGINFSQITFDIDPEEKIITITIPEVEFHEKKVNPGTLEFIFNDKESETETVHREAFELCQTDLEERVEKEEGLLEQAQENAKQVVEALVTPWVTQIDREYRIVIQ